MTLPKINFTWDINLGAVLQMLTVISATITLTVVGIKFWYDTEAGIKRADDFQAVNGPVISNLVKSDEVQGVKIDAMSGTIDDLRNVGRDNQQKLNDIAANVAEIKGRLSGTVAR